MAISVDGTYRIMSQNGQDWPLLNGGPTSNYYSGPGDSEYSTTVMNCLFQFCRVECQDSYESYFRTLRDLPQVLFGSPPLLVHIVGSDRSRSIINAANTVFPGVHCVLCWPHVFLYVRSGKIARHMSSTCTTEMREKIEGDIFTLHEVKSEMMFDILLKSMMQVWTTNGEGGFAEYFERHYGTNVFKRWWVGSSLEKGVSANQNPKESDHAFQKSVLGKSSLKATPFVVATKSAPLILAAEGRKNDEEHKWPATLVVAPRLTAKVAAHARALQATIKTVSVCRCV
jgi:hypothetical protein